jgi:hypothetical protein
MGRLRIAATTVLVVGALVPALAPGRFFNGGSTYPVAALHAVHSLPKITVDNTKVDDLEIAQASLRAYVLTEENNRNYSVRAKASEAAFKADPTVQAAQAEMKRAGEVYWRRRTINDSRLRVLSSLLMVLVALAVTTGLHRFRRGSKRVGALLFVVGIAFAPLAIPNASNGDFAVPALALFARSPADPAQAGDWAWHSPKPAPAGEIWKAAAIDKTRAVARPTWGSSLFADDGLIPIDYSGASRWAVLIPSAVAALAALLALLAVRPLRRLLAWSPPFRRHFPTLWPQGAVATS